MRVEFEGQMHEFPDDASESEIQAMLSSAAPQAKADEPSKFSAIADAYGRMEGLGARAAIGGGLKGLAGAATLPVDAMVNAGYGAHKLLAKTGAVSQPDPNFYYGKSDSFMPATAGISDAVDEGMDKVGLPRPQTFGEKVVSGVGEGVTGALTGSGFGKAIGTGVGAFLAAEPGVQAAAGAAAGGAGAAAGADPRIAENLPPWAPAAIGALAGVGTGTGISATRAFAGYVPGRGYMSTRSTGGQEAIARQAVQDLANTGEGTAESAARNLRNRTDIETNPDFVAPGYQEITTNAAQNTGLAAARSTFRDMSGGRIAERAQDNNVALTRAFERQGARADAIDTPTRQAREFARQDLPRFGLTADGIVHNPEPIEVTPFLRQLGRETDPQRPGTTAATRSAAGEIRDTLRRVSDHQVVPNAGEGMGPINRFMALPERLQSVRQDLSESLAPARPNSAPPLPSVANARGFTGRQMGTIDEILANHTPEIPGPHGTTKTYPEYMAQQRGLRQEGTERAFMRALLEDVGPTTNPITDAQEIRAPRLAQIMNQKNVTRAVPGGGNMSISRLQPPRQAFLQDMEQLGQTANFGNTAGLGSVGSNTARNAGILGDIAGAVRANQAPYERVLGLAARGALAIPGVGLVARPLGRAYQAVRGESGPRAVQGVRDRLAEFETNRPAAIDLLSGPGLPARGVGLSTARQIGRTARYGAQSLLASQLSDRERRRARRPYGT
jgi:hypothetical protein